MLITTNYTQTKERPIFGLSLVIVSFLLTIGCDQIANEQTDKLTVSDDYRTKIDMSEWTESHKFLKLESPNDFIIGKVSKILLADSLIFIYERKRMNIYCFDLKGKYQFRIENLNSTIGESFEYVRDIAWDKYYKELYAVDYNANKLFVFSDNGKFIRTIKPKVRPSAIYRITKDNWVINNGYAGSSEYPDKIYIVNNDFNKVISSSIESDKISPTITIPNPFVQVRDEIRFLQGFDNNIYTINRDLQIKPKLSIDFGELNFTDKAKSLPMREIMQTFMKEEYAGLPVNYMENDHFISFTYTRNGQSRIKGSRFVFQAKGNSQKPLIFKKQYMGKIEIPKPSFLYNNQFISLIDFFKINTTNEERLSSKKHQGRSPDFGWYDSMEEVQFNTKSLDSPILIFYEAK